MKKKRKQIKKKRKQIKKKKLTEERSGFVTLGDYMSNEERRGGD